MIDELIDEMETRLVTGGLIEEIAAAARRHRVYVTLSVGATRIAAGPAEDIDGTDG